MAEMKNNKLFKDRAEEKDPHVIESVPEPKPVEQIIKPQANKNAWDMLG